MFTIQYATPGGDHKMQTFDSTNRRKLVIHLASFPAPIVAVYEQGTVITKAIRNELRNWPGSKTRYATEFANSLR